MIRFDCRLDRADFSLDAAFESDAGITGLVGPSGSGKSTVIQLIAGLARPTRGRITLDATTLLDTERGVAVPAHRRGVGLVFQDALLFPHLSVRRNLAYGRTFNPRREHAITFDQVVGVLGIGHLLDRAPATLSGGERQRVAIGRALLASPAMLLMDEPLSSLDAARKLEILPFIERLHGEFAIPILYVSHAAEEIARLAGTVIRIEAGKVIAAGSPDTVLAAAATGGSLERFDAVSILQGRLQRFDATYGVSLIAHAAGEIVVPGRVRQPPGGLVRVAVRATNVTLLIGAPGRFSIRTVLAGRVDSVGHDGPFSRVTLCLTGGDRLVAYLTRLAVDDLGLVPGIEVQALVKAVAIDERGVTGLQTG